MNTGNVDHGQYIMYNNGSTVEWLSVVFVECLVVVWYSIRQQLMTSITRLVLVVTTTIILLPTSYYSSSLYYIILD